MWGLNKLCDYQSPLISENKIKLQLINHNNSSPQGVSLMIKLYREEDYSSQVIKDPHWIYYQFFSRVK